MPDSKTRFNTAPIAPVRPDNDECCHSGCEPCIFELYEEALERYRVELKAWQASQKKAGR
ncbi:MAG TPA: oxidoreductase-like domain-containing protein [Methylobacter sp.]